MKSMLKLILLFLLAYQRSSTHELVEELTDINFNETITNQPVSAVLFYASKDCEMCSQMVKRFTTAASRLVEFEQPIGFYKIDCLDEGKDTCDEQMVIDPPTIEIYRHGEYANEVKRIQLQQMIEIIKKVARMGSIRVDTLQELDDLLNMNLYVVLGLFEDDSDLRKVYLSNI
ncbi:unnamed protein product [Acanthoscelides obtectus]|uniref:Thioredoxin domain-containing protein n=1 Tax=Acanthoscelides obtectus TaxID=200917 RepID=A0A9P0JZI7_ACAOB|nr:unnamed protein product [Acanthoscelides obtectus]CAK1663947.1 hypothetical protein AOBTE_LOCUS23950 [Acanthoscelides obtectus]